MRRRRRHPVSRRGSIWVLVLVALWLGYGAAAARWPALDLFPAGPSGEGGSWSGASGERWLALDGDTLLGPGVLKIRVAGLDTPELHPCRCAQECSLGERARARTQSLVSHASVAVQPTGRDPYGRTLARVHVDGRDLGAILIAEGLARPYSGGPRQPWCG